MENGTHNLVSLLLVEAPYVKKYKEAFPRPTKRPGIYSTTLNKEDNDVVCAKGGATHRANQEDCVLYNVVEKATAKFFPWAFPKTYILALCEGPPMYMCNVIVMTILVHLQKNETGNHEINILVLQDAMRQYHHKYNTIAKYIKAMELAQKQSKQAKQNITDAMLVAMAIEAFLDVERHPKANGDWEKKDRVDRSWENWKVLYLKADANALLKRKAKGHVG